MVEFPWTLRVTNVGGIHSLFESRESLILFLEYSRLYSLGVGTFNWLRNLVDRFVFIGVENKVIKVRIYS